MKRRVSDIAVMILSFLVLLALSAETALVGVEAVRGEQWQLIRLTAWLQGSGVWGGIACIAVAVLALVLAHYSGGGCEYPAVRRGTAKAD